MCFTIHEDNKERKIAREDIDCYKTMFRKMDIKGNIYFVSLYQSFEYEKNLIYSVVLQEPFDKEIKDCFHSYSDDIIARLDIRLPYYINFFVVRCTIPKGAEYYFNPIRREFVSNTIIILGIEE